MDGYWFDGRAPDARDVMEWMERWGGWLPDEEGQFRFWSIFLPCEVMEALYRYVHGLVHDFYLEIFEMHTVWEQEMAHANARGEGIPSIHSGPPESLIYWHPRLIIDDFELTLTKDNAEELRDWSYDAFCSWKQNITEDQKEALFMLGYEADQLCAVRRWPD